MTTFADIVADAHGECDCGAGDDWVHLADCASRSTDPAAILADPRLVELLIRALYDTDRLIAFAAEVSETDAADILNDETGRADYAAAIIRSLGATDE